MFALIDAAVGIFTLIDTFLTSPQPRRLNQSMMEIRQTKSRVIGIDGRGKSSGGGSQGAARGDACQAEPDDQQHLRRWLGDGPAHR